MDIAGQHQLLLDFAIIPAQGIQSVFIILPLKKNNRLL